MKYQWHYDGYHFNLEVKNISRKYLDKIMDFLEELDKNEFTDGGDK